VSADPPRGRVAEIQRARLLAAAVTVVDELGCAGATVARITGRARVSRRTFYELFADREQCLAAALADVVERVEREIRATGVTGHSWREQLRNGLWAILCYFDREPVLARLCVMHSAGGPPGLLACRQEVVARLARIVDDGRRQAGARAAGCSALTAEGVVGAGLTIVYGRLLQAGREPLAGLLGELMGIVVLPYMGAAAARRERERPLPRVPAAGANNAYGLGLTGGDPLQGVSMRLTYRTARVLEGVAACPGASNRQVADFAAIADQGQVSKLLSRLERLGLLTNTGLGHGKGEPNAWQLTLKGRQIVQSIQLSSLGDGQAARRAA
jgi:AcrR family transcriptional regulator